MEEGAVEEEQGGDRRSSVFRASTASGLGHVTKLVASAVFKEKLSDTSVVSFK